MLCISEVRRISLAPGEAEAGKTRVSPPLVLRQISTDQCTVFVRSATAPVLPALVSPSLELRTTAQPSMVWNPEPSLALTGLHSLA